MSKINLNLKYMIFQHVTLTDPVSGYFVGKIEARVSYEKTGVHKRHKYLRCVHGQPAD